MSHDYTAVSMLYTLILLLHDLKWQRRIFLDVFGTRAA